MQSPIETLKNNLMRAYLFEAYIISSILTNDGRPPAHDHISDQAVIVVRDAIIQSQKLMQCLLVLERSSAFRDFVTRMDTDTPQLTQPGFFSSPPKKLSQGQSQIPENLKTFLMAFMLNDDDLHPHNFNLEGLLDYDRPHEKDLLKSINFNRMCSGGRS